jgi:energy-coupling factor transport system permease protein
MREFEFLRNVTVGQDLPTNSPVHRLDPRTKLLLALLMVLAATSTTSLLTTLLLLGVLGGTTGIAQLDARYVLRGVLPVAPFLLFLMAMQLLFQGRFSLCSTVWYEWHFVRLTPCLLELVLLGALRLLLFLFVLSLLTLTTTAAYLLHGIEQLLGPLQRIGLPVHEFALANIIALRFIPTIAEELERVAKAQVSRGGEFGSEPWYRPDRVARARLPLLVPLFVNTLRRAEELVVAMQARSYLGSQGRSRFVELRLKPADWGALALGGTLLLLVWRLA